MSNHRVSINIIGKLSAFGALGIALLILTFIFKTAGDAELAQTAQTIGVVVLGIVISGAILKIYQTKFA